MQIKSIIVTAIISLSAQQCLANNVCHNESGTLYCTDGTVDSIYHLGDTSLSGTHVVGEVKVLGKLDAINSEIGSGSIIGDVDISRLTVHNSISVTGDIHSVNSVYQSAVKFTGDLKGNNNTYEGKTEFIGDVKINDDTFKNSAIFTGKLRADAANFNNGITINSCLVEFYHSNTGQIIVNLQRHCDDGVQKIYLKDKTEVKGNINFVGGNGKVYVSKNSAIIGQVTGGTIVRE